MYCLQIYIKFSEQRNKNYIRKLITANKQIKNFSGTRVEKTT